MSMYQLVISALFMLAGGGLAFAFLEPILTGENKAEKRQKTFVAANVRSSAKANDPNKRRKQVSDTLKEIEMRNMANNKTSLAEKIAQAGYEWSKQKYFIICAVSGVVCFILGMLVTGSLMYALPIMLVGAAGLPMWFLTFQRNRRIGKFIQELPNAMDVIVRGVKSGLPLGDCVRIIATEAAEPVRTEFRHIVETQTLGLTLPEACMTMFRRVPCSEANFFGIVIEIQSKAGGNLSEALGNLSRVLRERRKMRGKVQAMSMEAKASAAIIATLPFTVAILVYISSPGYISMLWTTEAGKMAMLISAFWMAIGIMTMKKMINFDI